MTRLQNAFDFDGEGGANLRPTIPVDMAVKAGGPKGARVLAKIPVAAVDRGQLALVLAHNAFLVCLIRRPHRAGDDIMGWGAADWTRPQSLHMVGKGK